MLAIDSKVWTETESTGYGVYTYENTSTFDIDVYNADYKVDITFTNPTDSAYTAYIEAQDITRKSDISVSAGGTNTVSVQACVVDGQLNLKFLGSSTATSDSEASVKTVYVSSVKVTRLATNESGSKPTIFIASDSTVQTYEKNYYPQTGWGQTLAQFFGTEINEYECDDCNFSQAQTYETENVVVENRAIGGRSSKSYVEEGKLDDLLEDVKPGDYLLVQWGHNDATSSRPNRYVSPDDFRGWLMYYVNGAKQRGATPVLVTPVARYSYTTNADGTLKSFASNFEAYRQVMLKVADEGFSESKGYGFTDVSANANKGYSLSTDENYADVYNDCVLGWVTDGSVEFDVAVPNGTYDVTFYIGNGSGYVYNKVTAEEAEFTDVRRGNSSKEGSCETISVYVTDGILNIVNTISKGGMAAIYFSGLEVVQTKAAEADGDTKDEDKTDSSVTTDKTYVYTDKSVASGKTYSYKIAAVVDGKTSFMSRAIDIETAVAIESVAALEDVTIVEGTPLEEGKTVASLLPATVSVKTEQGDEVQADVTWDVSELDINKTGKYTVYGTIKGYDGKLFLKVEVVANEVIGYAEIADITSIIGVEVTLPETVAVTYTNTTIEQKKVTWDTSSLDITRIADYKLTGTVEGTEDTVQVIVHVVDTYITSVPVTYAEVTYQSEDAASQLPATVSAIYADEKTGNSVVTWNADEVAAIDTKTIGTYKITGTIDGFDEAVEAQITVAYKVVSAFDFGIKDKTAADGYTTVTVNAKGGSKTVAELGIGYSQEKGYGFLNETASIQGREEEYTNEGLLTKAVYTDFAIPDGQTFAVDLTNGTYQVDIVGGSAYKSTVKGTIEGTAVSVGNAAGTYTVKSIEVAVEDGQLTCEFNAGATSRLDAIIIREIKVESENGGESEETEESSEEESSSEMEESSEEESSSETEESSEEESTSENEATTGGNDSGNGNTSSGSSNSGNSSNNNNSNNGSNSEESGSNRNSTGIVSTKQTVIMDENTPLAEMVTEGGLPYVNVEVDKKARLRAELLQKYYGRNLYLMAHLGNGIGFTIDASGVDEKPDTLELGSALEQIPNFADGFVSFHFKPYHTKTLPYVIGIHMNVGSYNGQIAYMFSRNLITGEYTLSSVTTVNEIGNVALQTNQMTDIMVLIAK